MVLKAEGIILRKYELRETSYILVVFTKEFGKIKGVMKGISKPYPQFAGNFEPFAKSQVLFYRKNKSSLDLITRCEALDFFLPIRKSIERLTYANYFIELIDIVTADYDANEALYQVLVESLDMLAGTHSAKRVGRIFELKFLGALGLSPQLDVCARCGSEVKEASLFSVNQGGLLCRGCAGNGNREIEISLGSVKFMRKIQSSSIEKTVHVKVSREVGVQTEKVLRNFLHYHINRPVKSLKFLAGLEKSGIV